MPTLSVTVIGLVVATFLLIRNRSTPGRTLVMGLLGAWAGFALGAFAGLVVDVIMGDGVYVAIGGHAGAVAGAVMAVRWRERREAGHAA